jgi:HAMP domain-containing protein
MPITVTLSLGILGLFFWLVVVWRRSEAASRELAEARRALAVVSGELRAAQSEILELQIRVDRLDRGDGQPFGIGADRT